MQAIDAFHGTKTILIVTHRASTLEYCDRVVMLEHGTAIETGIPVRETAPISPSKTRMEPLD
jgi:ABC-type multidrug transport system fused ATPase/permease subunit